MRKEPPEEAAQILEEVREMQNDVKKTAEMVMNGEPIPSEVIEHMRDTAADVNILLDIKERAESLEE